MLCQVPRCAQASFHAQFYDPASLRRDFDEGDSELARENQRGNVRGTCTCYVSPEFPSL